MNCKTCHQVFPGTGQARDILAFGKHSQMVDMQLDIHQDSIANMNSLSTMTTSSDFHGDWPGHSFHAKCVDEWLTEKSRSCSLASPYG